MDVEVATVDEIEQRLLDRESVIARARAEQMALLREVDRRQVPTAVGCGSLGEWVRSRLAPLAVGRRTRAIAPQLRRFIIDRDGAACPIAGCTSRYRLQVHHIVRWIDGSRTEPENLTTVCWFHHHVVIHGEGFTIDPDTPPQRRRLLAPSIHSPPWLEHARTKGMVITETPRHQTAVQPPSQESPSPPRSEEDAAELVLGLNRRVVSTTPSSNRWTRRVP